MRFHIIEKGEVTVKLGDGRDVNKLRVGDYFGEVSVLESSPPTATVVALSDTQTVTLDRAAFKRMLGDEVIDALTEAGPGGASCHHAVTPSCHHAITPSCHLRRVFTQEHTRGFNCIM